jgi:hypothetical protein
MEPPGSEKVLIKDFLLPPLGKDAAGERHYLRTEVQRCQRPIKIFFVLENSYTSLMDSESECQFVTNFLKKFCRGFPQRFVFNQAKK